MPGRTAGQREDLLIGAAIGLGMTARAAAQGGADFLLALNAGRLRVMGAPSNAAMLPVRAANAFTDDFARREILGRVEIPVLFGACVFDPATSLDQLLDQVEEAGYAGVTNFPTAIHLDGSFRAALEAAGLGFGREVELLQKARARGLDTLGYAKTREEVAAMAQAGVAKLCLNFGWNAGGSLGIPGGVGLEAAVDRAKRLFRLTRRLSPPTQCFVEGGPIVLPEDALQVCDASDADGYIGGSTLDRLPLEMSVMQTTSAFKTAPLLRASREGAEREQRRIGATAGLIGVSAAMERVTERISRLVATDLAILVVGEPGAGKTTAARAVHVASRRLGPFRVLEAADPTLATQLFGAVDRGALDVPDGTVVVEGIEALPAPMQARLGAWIERGVVERFGRGDRLPRARLVLTLTEGVERLPGIDALAARLAASRIDLPPLRARLEDLPVLVQVMLGSLRRGGKAPELAPGALRELISHDWPGNVRELEILLGKAATRRDAISAVDLRALLRPDDRVAPRPDQSERDWILDGLRRCRFRRAETAAFLGISRKTLYNRMRAYRLSD